MNGSVTRNSVRSKRRVVEATIAASLFSGAPSVLLTLARDGLGGAWHYGVDATRAIGVLVPPGRPGLARGAAAHLAISTAVGEALGRFVPRRHSLLWAGAGGAAMGLVGVGIIGRRYPGIRALPLGPQLADNIAFGIIFAAVADRRQNISMKTSPISGPSGGSAIAVIGGRRY